MPTTLPPLAADDLGTDVALTDDLAPVWGVASGKLNVAMAIYRRLTTSRGGLFYDASYGYNLTDLLNADLSAADISAARGAIIAECEKDERVQAATATLSFRQELGQLTIEVELDTALGPFDLVLRATQVTVEIVRIAGQAVLPTISARPDVAGKDLGVGPGGGVVAGPPSVSGLRLHLDAALGVTLDGAKASGWADQSGNGLDVSQTDDGSRPVFTASGINGLPAMQTDHDTRMECATDLFADGAAFTMFVVAKADSGGHGFFLGIKRSELSNSFGVWNPGTDTTMPSGTIVPYSNLQAIGVDAGHLVVKAEQSDLTAGDLVFAHVYAYRFAGIGVGSGLVELFVDGGVRSITGDAVVPETGDPGFVVLGAFFPNDFTVSGFLGQVSQLRAYDTALSDDDLAGIVGYLRTKYAV